MHKELSVNTNGDSTNNSPVSNLRLKRMGRVTDPPSIILPTEVAPNNDSPSTTTTVVTNTHVAVNPMSINVEATQHIIANAPVSNAASLMHYYLQHTHQNNQAPVITDTPDLMALDKTSDIDSDAMSIDGDEYDYMITDSYGWADNSYFQRKI